MHACRGAQAPLAANVCKPSRQAQTKAIQQYRHQPLELESLYFSTDDTHDDLRTSMIRNPRPCCGAIGPWDPKHWLHLQSCSCLLSRPTWDGVAFSGGGAHQLEALLRNLQVILGLLLLPHRSVHHACRRQQECRAGRLCRKDKQTECCLTAVYARSAVPAEGLLVGTWQRTKAESNALQVPPCSDHRVQLRHAAASVAVLWPPFQKCNRGTHKSSSKSASDRQEAVKATRKTQPSSRTLGPEQDE